MKFSSLFAMLIVAVVMLAMALPAFAGCRGGKCHRGHRTGPTACGTYGGHCHR